MGPTSAGSRRRQISFPGCWTSPGAKVGEVNLQKKATSTQLPTFNELNYPCQNLTPPMWYRGATNTGHDETQTDHEGGKHHQIHGFTR